jgi:23S rRNA pseudouridine1911/1915/1917 synthase
VQRVIDAGGVTVNGKPAKASYKVRHGDVIHVRPPEPPRPGPAAEDIPLEILFEDEYLAIINKPADMVVHPAKGNWTGTLVNALRHHFPQLSGLNGDYRAGIVHRLDRDTSGVIVIAKNDIAHHRLAAQFADRTIEKQYLAIVVGAPDRDRDIIDRPIGAHPTNRKNMAIRPNDPTSRAAQSFFEVRERFRQFALVAIHPKTGRTHQIRVHLASIGHPVLCDAQYGGRDQITRGELLGGKPDDEVVLTRQALHAERLSFAHPEDGREITVVAPLPEDMTNILAALRAQTGR